MTKAPFSVEWLSQSSQASKPDRDRTAVEGDLAGRPSLLEDVEVRQGNTSSDFKPEGTGESPARGKVISRAQASEHLPMFQKDLGASSSTSPALAAPMRAWSPRECGSDGEGSLSEGQTREESGGRSTSSRRLRTAFSLEQISTLESSFKRHKYLGAAERRKLAHKMQLSEVQIKTWFQNRRMKLKRQLQEMRPEPFQAVPFYNPLPFGPQSGPLSYVYAPHQQMFPGREAFAAGTTFPPGIAPTVDPRNTTGVPPSAVWPMPLPYFVGYQDPRTVFMTL